MTFDRLVNFHRLDNLIWVWNANAPNGKNAGPYYDYYPGAQYTDILAADVYGKFEQSHHDDLVELAKGKPIALGEIGAPPPMEALKTQQKWAWFMGWSDIFDRRVTDNHKALFDDPRTLSRGDPLPHP
jgi:mannan endo-1,4-beta-mannosidase